MTSLRPTPRQEKKTDFIIFSKLAMGPVFSLVYHIFRFGTQRFHIVWLGNMEGLGRLRPSRLPGKFPTGCVLAKLSALPLSRYARRNPCGTTHCLNLKTSKRSIQSCMPGVHTPFSRPISLPVPGRHINALVIHAIWGSFQ